MKNAYMETLPAEREALRGTFDYSYYGYTLGKILIKKAKDRFFRLDPSAHIKEFHDKLLELGGCTCRLTGRAARIDVRLRSDPSIGVSSLICVNPRMPSEDSLEGRTDSGLEIRRILLLTRLKDASKGMTLPQIVKDCSKVSGWNVSGKSGEEIAHEVLQSLIDDKLVALGTRFGATTKGLEYLEDPLQWQIDDKTTEELADRMFWKEVYDVFDKAYHKLRSKN